MMLVSVKICFRGQINCQQNAENELKSMPLFGAASQVGVPTMRRLLESSVEYVRRKVFSGPECDKFDTLAEANKFLFRECMKLNAKAIYDNSIPAETFETEKQFLLPAMPKFESCIKSKGKVDKYSTVMVARNHYSVPDTYVAKEVDVRLYTDKVVIYHDGSIIARHDRDFGVQQWRINIYHYLRTLKRKTRCPTSKHSTASVGHHG